MDNHWQPLKEPGNFKIVLLYSVPFLFLNVMITLGLIKGISDVSLQEFGIKPDSLTITFDIRILFGLILLLVTHELIHLILVPDFIKSSQTYLGITLFGGFVYTEEIITKARYILITIAPFIVLSILLPIMLNIFGLLHPILKFFILLNAASSCVDMLSLSLIISQVPNGSLLINNGIKTYWKQQI